MATKKSTKKEDIKALPTPEKQEQHQEQSSQTRSEYKRMYRAKEGAIIGGVAAGLGEYFAIDPVVIRLLFVLSSVFGGFGVPVYIILWIILPSQDKGEAGTDETMKENINEMKAKTKAFAEKIKGNPTPSQSNSQNTLAIVLILLGFVFIMNNFGLIRFDIFWPLLLIVFGVWLFTRSK